MSNLIKVSVPKMNGDCEKLQADFQKIPDVIHDLEDAIKRLGTCWEGPAWIAFQQQVQTDINNMYELCEDLKGYLQSMAEAEKKYGECEQKTYDVINRVRI